MKRTPLSTNAAALDLRHGNPQAALLAVGEETQPRPMGLSGTNGTIGTQTLRLSYFTARKSETTTQVRVISGGTAAGATPTLARIGLYLVDPDTGGGTLVASTVNDTTLFAATNTAYTKSWSASYAKVAGQRYAVGLLFVTSATAPTSTGYGITAAAEMAAAPRIAGSLSGQADLPANFTEAALGQTGSAFYAVLLP